MSHDPQRPDADGKPKKTAKVSDEGNRRKAIDDRTNAPTASDAGLQRDGSSEDRDAPARQLGFRSYAALLAASTPIAARDGRIHLIVESHDGRWLVWCEETWPEFRTFDTVHHAGRAVGEATEPT